MVDDSGLKVLLDSFQKSVKKLGDSINKCGIEWNDAQYSSLSSSIKGVAASSRQVIVIGSKCCSAIKRFNAIESEK